MIPGKSWTKREAFLRLCVEGFRIYSLDCLMANTTSQRCTQVKEKGKKVKVEACINPAANEKMKIKLELRKSKFFVLLKAIFCILVYHFSGLCQTSVLIGFPGIGLPGTNLLRLFFTLEFRLSTF